MKDTIRDGTCLGDKKGDRAVLRFNTIRSYYNYDEREKLNAELLRLEEEEQTLLNAVPDGEEFDDEFDEIHDRYRERIKSQFRKCFAAQFPKCRNKWFKQVVEGFPSDGKSHSITKKQYYTFSRYACHEDENNWKSHESYCRVDNKLVTLWAWNGWCSITIELLD